MPHSIPENEHHELSSNEMQTAQKIIKLLQSYMLPPTAAFSPSTSFTDTDSNSSSPNSSGSESSRSVSPAPSVENVTEKPTTLCTQIGDDVSGDAATTKTVTEKPGIPVLNNNLHCLFTHQIFAFLATKSKILLALPAFPFKSPNTTSKVLGTLPDKGEEFALAHLDGLCEGIKRIYSPGARVCIVSDGAVYNDILGVPDSDVWAYGETLRVMAVDRGFDRNIEFVRLHNLLNVNIDINTDISYIQQSGILRNKLVEKYTPENFDPAKAIKEDGDIRATYRGYIKFLSKDLAQSNQPGESSKSIKKRNSKIAKSMILRGKAFAMAICDRFPDYIRLSIHPSSNTTKVSISLFPKNPKNTCAMTPWHSAPLFDIYGNIKVGHKDQHYGDVELVCRPDGSGCPWLFREGSELYDWTSASLSIHVEPIYPTGLLITPLGPGPHTVKKVPMHKVRALAELNSPIILRGFHSDSGERRGVFEAKAAELGTIMEWKFGKVLVVKDAGAGGFMNNVLSAECMPFHYDGVFKLNEKGVSTPPQFQIFTAVTPSPKNTGFTLFSSSSRIFQHLPAGLTIDDLKTKTWSVKTGGFGAPELEALPLVIKHPGLGYPCFRYHERWGAEKTKFEPTYVTIDGAEEGEGERLCAALDEVMYDRRVCYWHAWEMGDVVVSDNVANMHTRSDFVGGSPRELWRIHVD